MFRKCHLMAALLLCSTAAVFSGDLRSRDDIQLQRFQNLFLDFGAAIPTASYPVRDSEMYSALINLLIRMENREGALLERVDRWEQRKIELEQQLREAQQDADEGMHGDALQILVWPPPEEELENEMAGPLEELYSWRPHESLEELQELRARIENELEWLALRKYAPQTSFSQRTALQGYWNMMPDDLPFADYQQVVQPVIRASLAWGYDQGAGLQLTTEFRRRYNRGIKITNMPLPEDQNTLALDMNLISEVMFTAGYPGGYISAGRFPVHIGPGRASLSSSEMYPYHEGARLVISADRFRTAHLLSILDRTAQDETRLLVIHHAEVSGNSWRAGFGGQNLFLQPSLLADMQDYLPVAGWLARAPGSVNTQLIADFVFTPVPRSELYIQAGMQSSPDGWLADIPSGAVIAGARYQVPGERADTYVLLEGGWTDDDWGEFPDSHYRYQRSFSAPNSEVYLNSPFGPAALWGNADIDVQLADGVQFGVVMEMLAQKPLDPLGDVYDLSGSLGVRLGYTLEELLSIHIQPVIRADTDQLKPGVSGGILIRYSSEFE